MTFVRFFDSRKFRETWDLIIIEKKVNGATADRGNRFSLPSITLVSRYDISTSFAFDVTAADVFALASFEDFFGFCHVATTAAEILAAFVTRATSVAMPGKNEKT